jgi:hypothetical protein
MSNNVGKKCFKLWCVLCDVQFVTLSQTARHTDLILYMILRASSATLISPVSHIATTEYKISNFGFPSIAQFSRENS